MGISRIDQPEKHNHGYYVRLTRDGKTESKFFADKTVGGKRVARRAAKEYEAELLEKAAALKRRPRKPSVRNTSGKVGVSRTSYGDGPEATEYWQAAWIDNKGRRKSAKYSVKKYGEDKAKRLASRARREGLLAREQQR
jgi:molybdenum cofactor biosynthesis enzyme MoaA